MSKTKPAKTNKTEANKTDPVLCYVDGCWAYFTTLALADQWGDDWDDAPYEHNAGTPYLPHGPEESWSIVQVAFSVDLERPCDNTLNSHYSVQDINAGDTHWLRTSTWAKNKVRIPAGTPLSKFRELISQAGGKVYEETK